MTGIQSTCILHPLQCVANLILHIYWLFCLLNSDPNLIFQSFWIRISAWKQFKLGFLSRKRSMEKIWTFQKWSVNKLQCQCCGLNNNIKEHFYLLALFSIVLAFVRTEEEFSIEQLDSYHSKDKLNTTTTSGKRFADFLKSFHGFSDWKKKLLQLFYR